VVTLMSYVTQAEKSGRGAEATEANRK